LPITPKGMDIESKKDKGSFNELIGSCEVIERKEKQ